MSIVRHISKLSLWLGYQILFGDNRLFAFYTQCNNMHFCHNYNFYAKIINFFISLWIHIIQLAGFVFETIRACEPCVCQIYYSSIFFFYHFNTHISLNLPLLISFFFQFVFELLFSLILLYFPNKYLFLFLLSGFLHQNQPPAPQSGKNFPPDTNDYQKMWRQVSVTVNWIFHSGDSSFVSVVI